MTLWDGAGVFGDRRLEHGRGGGDTENARYNTSVKYAVTVGPLRLSALYQFGGFDQGNGSNGAFSTEVEGHFGPSCWTSWVRR